MSLEGALFESRRLLALGDAPGAARQLRALLAVQGIPSALEADARYLLAHALAETGDRDGMTAEWVEVVRLDALQPVRGLMEQDEFVAVAEAALGELSREHLAELRNVAILVADRPSEEMVAGGIDPRGTLGLYHGVPLARRSVSFGAPYADTIHLFRANLERVCPTRGALAARIRVTVLHETAHFFGYSEAQLRRMGLA